MSRASRLSGFTTAISGDTDLNVGIVTAQQLITDQTFTFTNLNVTGISTLSNLNVTGVATANNLNVTGVSTLGNVVVGGATTDLVVNGNARVTGILTVGTSSLTLNGDSSTITGITTINSVSLPSAGALSNRNIIINGAMRVAQRKTSATSVISEGYITCDRFYFNVNALGTWTVTQESDGPDGFYRSFGLDCTTADTSPVTSDACIIIYRVEGQDVQHLKYGTSAAEQSVLSFYVKSNKTGNATVAIKQPDNSNRLYSAQYTINAANTWERKTIIIPGDTSGLMYDDTGNGLQIEWPLNSGSDYTGGSHGGWKAADNTSRNASNLGLGGSTDDYYKITGVQLEVGNQATPFEHRSFGDDLIRCKRYYQKSYDYDTAPGQANHEENSMIALATSSTRLSAFVQYEVEMRNDPTETIYGTSGNSGKYASINSYTDVGDASVPNNHAASTGFHQITVTGASSGNHYQFHYTADAEI